ncbi:hypothetical protein [Halobacteriovorax sp. CON-3]|uniref:hypothetical protein n=1 Tax=Halobacteriovorax sp. CON-3 TaxID=3157710 RepID=UPI0037136206
MKSLILIIAGIILNSSFALTTTTNSCLSNECLKERATSFKAFLKSEEAFTNEYSKKFPNKMLQKLTNNLISEIATDFRDGSVERQTALGQFKANIKENGIHNGLLNPAIVFMDMYASMGMSDKVLGVANIVNTLNPSVGDELEKTFGIEIDRDYDLDAVKIDHDKESPFGGPRMGNFENDFGDESETPETGGVDGLAPRMGDSQFGVNEGEMVSPILANKLEQDKNNNGFVYSLSPTQEESLGCLKKCAVGGVLGSLAGIIFLKSPVAGVGIGSGIGTRCVYSCTNELKDKLEQKKKDKPRVSQPSDIDNPRGGGGKPDTPEVDDVVPPKKADDVENPEKPKDNIKPVDVPSDSSACGEQAKCEEEGSSLQVQREKQFDETIFNESHINTNFNSKLRLNDLVINFGYPSFEF